MLNRNDRKSLKRNRNGVSFLIFLCIILFIWIRIMYGSIVIYSNNNNELRHELDKSNNLCINRKRTIDSLICVINYKPIDNKIVAKTYNPIKKDSSKVDYLKVLKDTSKKL